MIRAFPSRDSIRLGSRISTEGSLAKQANCQVAVALSIANHHASLPVAYWLYLPKSWAEDQGSLCQSGRSCGDQLQN